MKNSAWYQKLWRKKLDELPLQQDAGSAWPGMKKLLDEQLPEAGLEGANKDKSFGTSLFSLLSYLIPVAVMIGAIGIGYFSLHLPIKPKTFQNQKTKQQVQATKVTGNLIKEDSAANGRILSTKERLLKGSADIKNTNTETVPIDIDRKITANKILPASLNPIKGKASQDSNKAIQVTLTKKNRPIIHRKPSSFVGREEADIISGRSSIIQKTIGGVLAARIKSRQPNGDKPMLDDSSQLNEKYSAINSKAAIGQHKMQTLVGNAVVSDQIKQSPTLAATIKNTSDQRKTSGKSGIEKIANTKNTAKGKKTKVWTTPPFNYGLEAGLNTGSKGSLYLGAFGAYALNRRWLVDAGIRINSLRQLSGEYSHPSYYRPDSLPPFKVIDSRKLLVLDIPVNLTYRISKVISIKAGPLLSFSLKQSAINSQLAPIADQRDTVYHSREINKAISNTTIGKVSFGFTGTISFHLKQLDLNGGYQLLSPYKVSSDLGSYRKTYHSVQLGIGYRFK